MTDTDVRHPDPRLLTTRCRNGCDLTAPGALVKTGYRKDGQPRMACGACRKKSKANRGAWTCTRCIVCGTYFERPRKYAYCSVTCRRRGVGKRTEAAKMTASEITMEIVRLDRLLEHARPWEKDEIRARIKALESKVRN